MCQGGIYNRLYQFTFITSKKYLVVLKQKEMDKEVVNEFKEFQAKEIEEKDPNEPKIHLLKLSKWFKRSLKNMI